MCSVCDRCSCRLLDARCKYDYYKLRGCVNCDVNMYVYKGDVSNFVFLHFR